MAESKNGAFGVHRIAVISDTHNLLRPEVAEILKTCEAVIHGGDISGPETFAKLKENGRLFAVRGNNDRDWAEEIPYVLEFELYGRRFWVTHKKKDIPKGVDADVVIYGHSHRYAQDYRDGTLYLNPGSCGPRRFGQAITMAVLTVKETGQSADESQAEADVYGNVDGGITVTRIDIPGSARQSARENVTVRREQVSADTITQIGRDLERGWTVSDIAARRKLSAELAEEIVRLYVTHPGVTPEQIMSKMGL